MGTYGVTDDDFEDGAWLEGKTITFEEFLQGFEGDVCAEVVANAWNKLAKKYKWNDRLKAGEKLK